MAAFRTYEDRLNPEKALIFRIIHINNLPWILDNGLCCGNHPNRNPQWVHIGNAELIQRRATQPVRHEYGGFVNDYVPFYFTPFSPMLLNIKSGRNGVPQRRNDEIVILVSSLRHIAQQQLRFLFTNGHASAAYSHFYSDLAHLDQIDWGILQRRDFQRDLNDPQKLDRYQAEALVHAHLPVSALLGIVCYTELAAVAIHREVQHRMLELRVLSQPGWYF